MPVSLFNSLLLPDLRLMLEEGDDAGLKEFCEALYPGMAAEVLEGLPPDLAWKVLSHSDARHQAEVFPFLSLPFQVAMVDSIDAETLTRLIEEMSSDDRVDLLERMDPEHVERLLPLLAQAERAEIRKMLSYPEDSAGSIMSTEYAWLPSDITVQEALERLRLQAPSRETIYYVYIVDDGRHLMGFVSLRKLIQSRPTAKIESIIDRGVISVRVDDDQEHVANEVLKYAFLAIPVVDDQNRLVGIVTHDDAAEVLQEEATEDAHLAGAVQPLEDGYIATPFWELCWKRGMWLVILLGAASLTAQVMQFLEGGESASWMVLFL
ncbi:MAG: magnesium transporter, partial [Planctomycetaceae bacterium]|nr:magnesium transporter [Planctomycetaceae bacterium]